MRPTRPRRNQNVLPFKRLGVAAAVVAAVALSLGGCKSDQAKGDAGDAHPVSSVSTGSSETAAKPDSGDRNAMTAEQVEKEYVVGPAAARDLNYRVAWQFANAGHGLRLFSVQNEAIFTLDDHNALTRIRAQDGTQLWKTTVANMLEQVLGVNLIADKVYLTTGGAILVLDGGTGSQLSKQPLDKIASTAPAPFDQYLIYGSRNGQLVWHSARVGYQYRSYQVAHTIDLPPVVEGDHVIVVGSDGKIMAISGATAKQYWGAQLLAAITTSPTTSKAAVYVAGMDQYLRAFNIDTGRGMWKVLTESPLTDSPVVIDERVYQQIPNQGLWCFTAVPLDMPGGELIWKSATVRGNVFQKRRDELWVWDDGGKRMTLVEPNRGSPIRTVDLPSVKRLLISDAKAADIYAASDDGRVERLTPRN